MLRKKLFEPNPQQEPPLDPDTNLLDLSIQNCAPNDVSKYFPNYHQEGFANRVIEIQRQLNNALKQENFLSPPVEYVVNPTEYARIPNELYIKTYCQSRKKLLFIGMNPGPNGMCQTGVPFGDTNWIKNWLRIEGPVSKPLGECPTKPVQGFHCTHKEPSGDKFWRLWSDICKTPENFFRSAFVYNYCPLAFFGANKNITPDKIKDRKKLEAICDRYYLDLINFMQPEIVIAIGKYTEKRTLEIFKSSNTNIPVIYMLHPSPQVPNNHDWPDKKLDEMGAPADNKKVIPDEVFMDKAFTFAREALENQEVPVGCIFVYENKIIAVGRNEVNETKNATRHAELVCIDQVINSHKDFKDVFKKTDVYVTVEPCIMCAAALYDLGVRSVVFGCKNDRFGGGTALDLSQILKPTIRVKGGLRAEEAMQLLKEFYRGQNPNAPESKVKKK